MGPQSDSSFRVAECLPPSPRELARQTCGISPPPGVPQTRNTGSASHPSSAPAPSRSQRLRRQTDCHCCESTPPPHSGPRTSTPAAFSRTPGPPARPALPSPLSATAHTVAAGTANTAGYAPPPTPGAPPHIPPPSTPAPGPRPEVRHRAAIERPSTPSPPSPHRKTSSQSRYTHPPA